MLNEAEKIKNLAEWFAGILTEQDRIFLSKARKAYTTSFLTGVRTRLGLSYLPGLTKAEVALQKRNYLIKQRLLNEKIEEIWGPDLSEQTEVLTAVLEETSKIIEAEQPVELKKERKFRNIFGKLR